MYGYSSPKEALNGICFSEQSLIQYAALSGGGNDLASEPPVRNFMPTSGSSSGIFAR